MLFKKFKPSNMVLSSIYMYIMIPVIVILLFVILLSVYLKGTYTDLLHSNLSTKVESLCDENEKALKALTVSVGFLEEDDVFLKTMDGGSVESDIKHSIKLIKKIKSANPSVDNVFIMDKSAERVYSCDGVFEKEEYFKNEYNYSDYSMSYWDNYKAPFSEKRILAPSPVNIKGENRDIIPIVFTRVGSKHVTNLLVINVSMAYIFDEFEKNDTGTNIIYAVVNKQSKEMFCENADFRQKIDNDLWRKTSTSGVTQFDYTINGQKFSVISYSPTSTILGYMYMALIPSSEINGQVYTIWTYFVLMWIVMIVLMIVLSRFSARGLYAPIKRMMAVLPNKYVGGSENDYMTILEYIQNTKLELQTYLPIVQERLIIGFLYGTTGEDELAELLEKNNLRFNHDYFSVVLVSMKPTLEYQKMFNNVQNENIHNGILEVICSFLPDGGEIYKLHIKNDVMCIIVNVDNEVKHEDIVNQLDDFVKIIEQDKALMRVRISAGEVQMGLEGLKLSFDHAMQELSGIAASTNVIFDTAAAKRDRKVSVFDSAAETKLTNYLLKGDVDEARDYINFLISSNLENYDSESSIFNLYVRITHSLLNLMRMKKIPWEGKSIDEIDVVSEFFVMSPIQLRDVIEKMLFLFINNSVSLKIDVAEIVEYIQQHYTEELHLDTLADKYNTSSSYLSRVLKGGLGMPFLSYITKLRVEKAKELLTKTEKSITEIGEEVGFVNRIAFTRAFTAQTSVSPSHYRKIQKE